MSNDRMLVAIASGFLDDDGLCEVIAGKTRIAPEILRERPQYADYYEADVRAAGAFAECRSEIRSTAPDGSCVFDY